MQGIHNIQTLLLLYLLLLNKEKDLGVLLLRSDYTQDYTQFYFWEGSCVMVPKGLNPIPTSILYQNLIPEFKQSAYSSQATKIVHLNKITQIIGTAFQ